MKISTRGLYALRMLVDLAEHKEEGFIPLRDVAERQDISKIYLEQIIALLKNTDFLNANRGYQGGYRLAKDAAKYTVGDVLRVTEGSLAPVTCNGEGEDSGCERSSYCMTVSVWRGLEKVITEYLDSVTIQDIIDRNGEYNAADHYVI